MTRTMYDSTTAADIPKSAKMVAGYLDGLYANVTHLHRRFPGVPVVTITVLGRAGADVCDCETGDLTPTSAAHWAKAEHAAGRHPTIYTYASNWPAVKRAVKAAGLLAGQVSYWIANYDDIPAIPKGAVAKQYINPPRSGGHFDLSVVADYWPGVDDKPKPKKPRSAKESKVKHAIKRKSKALAALVGGIVTWVTAALSDGHVTTNEWRALAAVLVPAVVTYFAPKNAAPKAKR